MTSTDCFGYFTNARHDYSTFAWMLYILKQIVCFFSVVRNILLNTLISGTKVKWEKWWVVCTIRDHCIPLLSLLSIKMSVHMHISVTLFYVHDLLLLLNTTHMVLNNNQSIIICFVDCFLPRRTGRCRAYFIRYFYDPDTSTCKQFVYGGCDGNNNNFLTKGQCVSRCVIEYDRELSKNWQLPWF